MTFHFQRTVATKALYGEFVPPRWVSRMRPSAMKLTEPNVIRCRRCGRYPDQSIGIRGEWIEEPVTLCTGCQDRVAFQGARHGLNFEDAITQYAIQAGSHADRERLWRRR